MPSAQFASGPSSAWRSFSRPEGGSQPHSGVCTPFHFKFPPSMSMSMPGSRSGSPPITLAPLKMATAAATDPTSFVSTSTGEENGTRSSGEDESGGGRVELPGFKEFEAAAFAPSP